MALARAVLAGAIAAVGVPTALRGLESSLGEFVSRRSVDFQLFDIGLRWSWTIFAAITLFAWIVLKGARGR